MSIAVAEPPETEGFIGHKANKGDNPTRGCVFVVVLFGISKLEIGPFGG